MLNKNLARGVLALFVITAIAVAVIYRDQFTVASIEQWLSEAGWWAPVAFILIYALAAVLFLPGSVLTLLGGALFGPVMGTVYNLTGATLGAALAFLVSRYIASDWVAQKSGGKVKQIIKGVESEGWRFIAFVRLVPLFPFNLLNYMLGMTRIPFLQYVLATYIFMLPGGFAYTWLGYTGRQAVDGGEGLVQNILIAIALLATVAFIPRLVKKIRHQPIAAADDESPTDVSQANASTTVTASATSNANAKEKAKQKKSQI